MKVSIGSDHGGFNLKEKIINHLKQSGIEVTDHGCYNLDSVDYPYYAQLVAEDVINEKADFGILVCTTGIGMSIAANKVKGIRAALVANVDAASLTRLHNNSNVLCLSQKYTEASLALSIVDTFLNSKFEGGRHSRRVDLIKKMEE